MKSTTINNAIKKVRELFNELRSNLSCEETKRIREKLYKKEAVYNFLKENDGLTEDNVMYGLDYFFNEVNEKDYYEPKEIKSAFDGNYVLYESKGDKDAKLALWEYFNKIRPYLRDMIDNHKAKGEWKIQFKMRIIFVSFIDALMKLK